MPLRDLPVCQPYNINMEKQPQDSTAAQETIASSERVTDCAKLEQEARQAAKVNQIVWQIRSSLVLDEVLQTTVDKLHEDLNVSRCVIFSPDRHYHAVSFNQAEENDFYSYYHQTLATGNSISIPAINTQLPEEIQESAKVAGIRSLLIVPLLYQETYLGGIVLHQCDKQREWKAEDIRFVEAIAQHCAVAIHQCQLYQQAQADLEKRQRVEDTLLANTYDLLEIIQSFPDLYFRLDSNGTILNYYTNRYLDLHVPARVFLNKPIQDIFPSDVSNRFQEALRQVAQTNSLVTIEYSLSVQETEKFFEARLLPSPSHQTLVIIRDITLKKQAEFALQESEERCRAIYQATFEGILIHVDNTIIEANLALAETLGYTLDELIKIKPLQLLAPESKKIALRHVLAGKEKPYEAIAFKKNGTKFQVEIQSKRINYQGCPATMTTARDISQQKQVEELLNNQKEFLRHIIDACPNLILAKNLQGQFTLANKALADIYGTTIDNILGKTEADFNSNNEKLEQFIYAEGEVIVSAKEKIITEETITNVAGEKRWFQIIKKPLSLGEETVPQVLIVATDITERKQIEIALQQAKDELELKVKERTTELRNANEQLQMEVRERQWAETLSGGQNRIMEMITTGAPLFDILTAIALFVEDKSTEAICTIQLIDETKTKLLPGVAPSLPESYNEVIKDGIIIGPQMGSCGTAVYYKKPVIVSDITTDKRWEIARDVVLPYGLRACYSVPIFDNTGEVLGSFALYYSTPRPPNLDDRQLVEICSHLAGLAIERMQAEEALHKSKEWFRNLVETTSDWVWEIDESGYYTYVSPKVRDLLGYEPEEVLGKTPFDFMPEAEGTYVANQFSFIVAAQRSFSGLQNTNIHKNGRVVVLETSGVPIFDTEETFRGYRGIDRDITERKKVEEALRMSENHLRTIIEAEPECVKLIDADGTLLDVNASGLEILELNTLDEAIGKSIYSFIVPEYREAFKELNQSVCQGNKGLLEFEIIGNKGTRRWMETHAVPLPRQSDGAIVQLAITRDITERKRVEEEMRKALEREKELNELKSRFVTMTSHEFRTPLSTILSSTELLQHYSARFTEEKKQEHLKRIKTAIHRMVSLLNDVLVIAKVEAGKLELQPAPLDIEKLCQDLIEESQQISDDTHTINFVKKGERSPAYMDGKLLQHIFSNLLSNAIKYSPQGGTIYFELAYEQDEVIFQVQDSGIGIPPEDVQRLFDSFHRATNVGTIPGTGLGLAIVKNCVDLHEGTITVTSQVGSGTTFIVKLPLIAKSDPERDT